MGRRCRLIQSEYLNNIVEQDRRNVKRRTWLAAGYGSLLTAWRTLQGSEAMDEAWDHDESTGSIGERRCWRLRV